ncbi:MAG: hypothetical protein ACE5JB_13895 [bacterium]
MFFPKAQPRKFTFTPFYYIKEDEKEKNKEQHRIKFKRLRHRTPHTQKSIVIMAVLVVLILFFSFYFWGLVKKEQRTFQIEDIKIEEAPNN